MPICNISMQGLHSRLLTSSETKWMQLGKLYYIDTQRLNLGIIHQDFDVMWDRAPYDLSILHYLLDADPMSVCNWCPLYSPSLYRRHDCAGATELAASIKGLAPCYGWSSADSRLL